ncbi:MAG: ATP-binding protein [Anaerolineae bacterium]|nr:ATP-binding protein [Anaerolineae bacterium]
MTFLGELRVEATLDNLTSAAYFVRGVGHRLKLAEDMLNDLELAVEEAATNTIQYAYAARQTGEMFVRGELLGDVLYLVIGHWGTAIDPARLEPFDASEPVDSRPQGGLRLQLIRKLVDDVQFFTSPAPSIPSTIMLSKRLPGPPPPVVGREE